MNQPIAKITGEHNLFTHTHSKNKMKKKKKVSQENKMMRTKQNDVQRTKQNKRERKCMQRRRKKPKKRSKRKAKGEKQRRNQLINGDTKMKVKEAKRNKNKSTRPNLMLTSETTQNASINRSSVFLFLNSSKQTSKNQNQEESFKLGRETNLNTTEREKSFNQMKASE